MTTIALTIWTFIGKVMSLLLTTWPQLHNFMSLLFNTLTRFVIAFLSRSKGLLISRLLLLITNLSLLVTTLTFLPTPNTILDKHDVTNCKLTFLNFIISPLHSVMLLECLSPRLLAKLNKHLSIILLKFQLIVI